MSLGVWVATVVSHVIVATVTYYICLVNGEARAKRKDLDNSPDM